MKKLILLFYCSIIAPLSLFAEVDLKTGDFYTNYKDLNYEPLKGIVLERSYNSASVTTGLFGYGWTSPYETKIYAIGDGNILIKEVGSTCQSCIENGSGNASIFIKEKGFFELFFIPSQPDQAKIDYAISQIIQMLIRDGKLDNTPIALGKKRRELAGSMSQRAAAWITYLEKGWLTNTTISTNNKWYSTNGELQNISFQENRFIRNYNNKSFETFNNKGTLLSKHDGNGKLIFEITYLMDKISEIKDGVGHLFKFQLNSKGLVSSIQIKNDKVSFEYNEQNALIKSIDIEKKARKYEYNQLNAIISIEFEKEKILIEYDPRTNRVIKFTDLDEGEINESKKYQYNKILKDDGSIDPYRFLTLTTIKDYDGKEVENSNEYELKEILGRPYTYKTIVTKNGIKTETIFTECGCGPLSIKRGYRYATFKYDGKSRMIEKESDNFILKATYHPELDKITRVEKKDKKSTETEVTDYAYTPHGDVTKVSSKTITIELFYNEKYLITKMISDEGTLTFVYNAIGKPIEINMANEGSITVKYDEKGAIEKVESSKGHTMAIKVTQAFQKLLTVTKPDGFNYNL
jgi:uncharacterized protein RhaS with RHS repeats